MFFKRVLGSGFDVGFSYRRAYQDLPGASQRLYGDVLVNQSAARGASSIAMIGLHSPKLTWKPI